MPPTIFALFPINIFFPINASIEIYILIFFSCFFPKFFNSLFVEKYRPSTLDDIILTDDNYAVFNQFKKQGEIPNLLFAGAPGIGKTSLAKIIVNSLMKQIASMTQSKIVSLIQQVGFVNLKDIILNKKLIY